MTKILISACLLGDAVRYDGLSKQIRHHSIERCLALNRFIKICPELEGGLSVPRTPAEIQTRNGLGQITVTTANGEDVSQAFNRGAHRTLELVKHHKIKIALLKANSPSCGNQQIYNGAFDGSLVSGIGVTAALLIKHGVTVFNEHQLDAFERALA